MRKFFASNTDDCKARSYSSRFKDFVDDDDDAVYGDDFWEYTPRNSQSPITGQPEAEPEATVKPVAAAKAAAKGKPAAKPRKANRGRKKAQTEPMAEVPNSVPQVDAETERGRMRWFNIDLCGPAWRFLRAMELLKISPADPDSPKRPPQRIGKEYRAMIVDEAVQWLNLRWRRLWRGRLTGADLDRFNLLMEALRIQEDRGRRLPIEAGIIAHVPPQFIASSLNLPVELVELYEQYLFDVRDMPPVREDVLERNLPFQWSWDERELALFVLLTAKGAGVYAYVELMRAVAQFGQEHDLLTPAGRIAERTEILFELFKYRRVGFPREIAIHLSPPDTVPQSPAAALFQMTPIDRRLATHIRRRIDVALDAVGEKLEPASLLAKSAAEAKRHQPPGQAADPATSQACNDDQQTETPPATKATAKKVAGKSRSATRAKVRKRA